MKFGKLDHVDDLDLSLPADFALNHRFFEQKIKPKSGPRIYCGAAKWGRKEWVGTIYPKGTKDQEFLNEYGKLFNSIELNASFHRFPPEAWIHKWREQVPEGFKFCPKVYRSISHRYWLKNVERLNNDFLLRVSELGDKLGCVFLQLSDKFTPNSLKDVKTYFSSLPEDIQFAVEFRHPAWFENTELKEEVYDLFLQNQKSLVITDAPGRRDAAHMMVTAPVVLIRFVGSDLHPTDFTRMDEWIQRISSWIENGVQDVYFFMHQSDEVAMVKSLRYFIEKINGTLQLNLSQPALIE